jgi:3-oxoacyl-[acyl-carrier protein] reductase
VGLSGTRTEPLEALAAELDGRAHVLACNLSDVQAVEGLVKRAVEALGSLDILVNNAGITRDGLAMRMSDDDWQSVIDVNLTATFRLCRAAIRGMMKARWGRIVNISSVVGTTGNAGQVNYAASKAGMVGLSKSLAAEVASRGITVNCVAPGFIETAMTDKLNDQQRDGILGSVPMGRMGKPDEIASAVLYLASSEAGYVTGTTLHVNGGMAMV